MATTLTKDGVQLYNLSQFWGHHMPEWPSTPGITSNTSSEYLPSHSIYSLIVMSFQIASSDA